MGVIRPTAETIINLNVKKAGVLATESNIKSNAFKKEIHKLNPNIKVYENPAPLLVPIIESGEQNWRGADSIIKKYLNPLLRRNINALILGCTHYPIIKKNVRRVLLKEKRGDIKLICENEIIPDKLADYLNRHPEIEKRLSKNHKRLYLTTDLTPRSKILGKLFLGKTIKPRLISL